MNIKLRKTIAKEKTKDLKNNILNGLLIHPRPQSNF